MVSTLAADDEIVSEAGKSGNTRKTTPDWTTEAKNGDHLWSRTSASGDFCFISDSDDCSRHGPRLKCASCKIIIHEECVSFCAEKIKCRFTFEDAGASLQREKTEVNHHWVPRRSQKGRCQRCFKCFQSKLPFGGKDSIAMSCTWCKVAFHNKKSCFQVKTDDVCALGLHSNAIVPSTWIVKLPAQECENAKNAFIIKPIPASVCKPVLIFINPKSGGNQGAKLLRTFQWLLNPRQVFDLTDGGPKFGLELFRKVPNLRILACGGDGTVGWILSVLDDLRIVPSPPIAVLPLGTGNDLARSLGWGGGYTDEPISKILTNVDEGEVTKLDRWIVKLSINPKVDLGTCEEGRSSLPLNVVNNYFSLGVDALIALEFHEAREARPDKFNSRFWNKMFYGQAGGKDLIQRKWKDLCNYVTLECDGKDMTYKLKDLKVHSILFLNIPSYGGGTTPWGSPVGKHFQAPQTDDGKIEVIGLTTYQLPLLQAGGHGSAIAQCNKAKMVTSCTIPVQVDGEPCRILPSVIEIDRLNTVNMVARTKGHVVYMVHLHLGIPDSIEIRFQGNNPRKHDFLAPGGDRIFTGVCMGGVDWGCNPHCDEILEVGHLSLQVKKLDMENYEAHHHHKKMLKDKAIPLGSLAVEFDRDLADIRVKVAKLLCEHSDIEGPCPKESDLKEEAEDSAIKEPLEWWFVDSCTVDKFYRIDRAQEQLYYVADICNENLYIVVEQPVIEQSPVSVDSGDVIIADVVSNEETNIAEKGEDSVSHESSTSSSSLHSNISNETKDMQDSSDTTEFDVISAATMGDVVQLAKLHSQGDDLMQADSEGRTALHHAAFIGNVQVVRYLTSYGPRDLLDKQENIMYHTALHRAATRGDRISCSFLVCAGASISIVDKQGYKAYHLAALVGDKILEDYLKTMEHPVIV